MVSPGQIFVSRPDTRRLLLTGQQQGSEHFSNDWLLRRQLRAVRLENGQEQLLQLVPVRYPSRSANYDLLEEVLMAACLKRQKKLLLLNARCSRNVVVTIGISIKCS